MRMAGTIGLKRIVYGARPARPTGPFSAEHLWLERIVLPTKVDRQRGTTKGEAPCLSIRFFVVPFLSISKPRPQSFLKMKQRSNWDAPSSSIAVNELASFANKP